jgi:membrane protein DedA with SNARE-associated domain
MVVGYAADRSSPVPPESLPVLAFIDQIVIPFLENLYGSVGYLGVLFAMTIESAMIPLPSETDPPLRGLLSSRTPRRSSRSPAQPWNYWLVVIAATIGNTLGSLVAYAIGAYGGRPFLERYGKYILIRQHEIELGRALLRQVRGPLQRSSAALLPIVRTFISFPRASLA